MFSVPIQPNWGQNRGQRLSSYFLLAYQVLMSFTLFWCHLPVINQTCFRCPPHSLFGVILTRILSIGIAFFLLYFFVEDEIPPNFKDSYRVEVTIYGIFAVTAFAIVFAFLFRMAFLPDLLGKLISCNYGFECGNGNSFVIQVCS